MDTYDAILDKIVPNKWTKCTECKSINAHKLGVIMKHYRIIYCICAHIVVLVITFMDVFDAILDKIVTNKCTKWTKCKSINAQNLSCNHETLLYHIMQLYTYSCKCGNFYGFLNFFSLTKCYQKSALNVPNLSLQNHLMWSQTIIVSYNTTVDL